MTIAPRFARALISGIAVIAVAAPLLANDQSQLRQVEASLTATQSMTATFIQTDGKGRSLSGNLSLKRPGRIRFEYGNGANMLLVGNGKTLSFIDYDVGQKSNWPVAKSPLAVLLADRPDLNRIARIVDSGNPSVVVVRARDNNHPEFGTLVLAFVKSPGAPGGLQLAGWTAVDAQNRKTKVRLDGQRYNVAVPESAFIFAEPRKKR